MEIIKVVKILAIGGNGSAYVYAIEYMTTIFIHFFASLQESNQNTIKKEMRIKPFEQTQMEINKREHSEETFRNERTDKRVNRWTSVSESRTEQ